MRRAAAPLLTAGLFALAACGDGDTAATSAQSEIYGNVTAPVSPGTQANDPNDQVTAPAPNYLGGDTAGVQTTPGTDTMGAIEPGTVRDPGANTVPPLPPTAPITSPRDTYGE